MPPRTRRVLTNQLQQNPLRHGVISYLCYACPQTVYVGRRTICSVQCYYSALVNVKRSVALEAYKGIVKAIPFE